MPATPNLAERRNLIEGIRTPLGFIALTILVSEALILGLALASAGIDRTILIVAAAGIPLLLALGVTVIAVWRPEALSGRRAVEFDEVLARGLAEEIYAAIATLDPISRDAVCESLPRALRASYYARSRSARKLYEIIAITIEHRHRMACVTLRNTGPPTIPRRGTHHTRLG